MSEIAAAHMNQYYNNDCNHKSQYFQLLEKDWKSQFSQLAFSKVAQENMAL